ncbi:MAG: thioredoxin family protein, partial [Oscillospiraceae bacterium]|nr:thioredoxin family protein [Oscillospiraceae bacterium]
LAATELEKYAASMQRKTGLVPQRPEREAPAAPVQEKPKSEEKSSGGLFDANMLAQLNTVFSKMASPLVLKLKLDERPVSRELKGYMEELSSLTDKLSVELSDEGEDAPVVRVCRPDGSWTGLAFHGVPGGHEFTSFVLGLYNAAGPGQAVDEDSLNKIRSIDKNVDIKVLVSLSCTMCPELVTAAQRIAAESDKVTAQVYDLNHYPEIRDRYNVMSVPCLVIGDGDVVSFGKKNVKQILDLI